MISSMSSDTECFYEIPHSVTMCSYIIFIIFALKRLEMFLLLFFDHNNWIRLLSDPKMQILSLKS